MRTNLKTTYRLIPAILMLFYIQNGFSQSGSSEIDTYLNLNSLSQEQKKIIQIEQKKIIETREAFKSSLSQEQLNILTNTTLSKEEKRSTLVASFSKVQRKLILESETRIKGMANRIKPTLTEKQKKDLKGLKQRYSKLKNGDSRGIRVNKNEYRNRIKRPKNNKNMDKVIDI